MPPDNYRRNHLIIDLQQLKANLRLLRQHAPQQKIMAVLKANAYGLGLEKISEALVEENIDAFGVAELSEALQLSQLKKDVYILGDILKEEIPIKVGVITGHSETNRIFNVIHNLNPSAYILKGKCSTDELTFAIQKMLKGEVYYTHEIHQKLLKRALVEIQMDDIAVQILKELPKHAKISNLEGLIKKSDGSLIKVRSIESKLSKLRTDLQANNNTDLVLKAKELGIID